MFTDAEVRSETELIYECGSSAALVSQYCDKPFSALAVKFCSELSRKLLSNVAAKQYPDLITFAFYCRSANLEKLMDSVGNIEYRLGWGCALHIAPANIPINFAYSFLFGLLAGNANVVRLPSKQYPQIDIFCCAVNEIFDSSEYHAIKCATAFVRFGRDSTFLKENIERFDILMVWGGDNTVREIRQLPRAPRSIDVSFSDRYSFSVMGAESVLQLNRESLEKLCSNFYNDTYLVDQNACSSPNLICWQGDAATVTSAKARFWVALQEHVALRYEMNAVHAMDKQIKILKYLETYSVDMKLNAYGPATVVATLAEIHEFNHQLKGVFGLFFELDQVSLKDVMVVVNSKYQTLSYFGVSPEEIIDTIFDQRCKGIDRIVPVGKALDIGITWDGFDLITTLSRKILLQ